MDIVKTVKYSKADQLKGDSTWYKLSSVEGPDWEAQSDCTFPLAGLVYLHCSNYLFFFFSYPPLHSPTKLQLNSCILTYYHFT